MHTRLLFLLAGGILFFSFVLFSYLVHEDLFTQLDFNTTVKLQDNIGRNWDREFSWFSELGSFEFMLIFLIMLFVVMRKWVAGAVAFVLFGCFHVIELFGKYMVNHPPPMHFMLRTENMLDFPQFHVRAEYSYPSGHAGRAFFLSVVLLVFVWQAKSIPFWGKVLLSCIIAGYDISMVISRVTLGEHWTTDVIGGALLGTSLGLLTSTFLIKHKILQQKQKESEIFIHKFPSKKGN